MQQQQQQQQQQGGSQFGLPPAEMAPFMLGVSGSERIQQLPANEAATPNSIRAPAGSATPSANFDELAPAVAGNFPEDESLAGGEEAERGDGGASGKRWPRQETLTLLKIRSEMDAAFRDATLKGPLWEEVSRKLAELGYRRSAKKCKEKFENVHKYYKRTKDGRAGRQDGKSYRFFAELEALHSTGATTPTAVSVPPVPSSAFMSDPPSSRPPSTAPAAPPTLATPTRVVLPEPPPVGCLTAAGISFSSSSTDSSSSEYDDEEAGGRKRKRRGVVPGGTSRKMMAYFDGLMKQVMERQEAMQQRFLEAIEKREQDRMIREEAWRRQETARISRDHELLSHERAVAASRDAAIISYLQKITSGLSTPATAATPISVAPQVQLSVPPPPAPPQRKAAATSDSEPPEAVASANAYDPVGSSSRWPKAEVHALIDIRSELETEFQEAGPKGTLWGEISARMQRVGYNRSAKRCKEKWENINKYFKKVKGGKKKRTGDSKTCPYYDQLDAIYRSKLLGETSTSQQAQQQAAAEAERNEGKKVNGDNNGSAENFEASGESVDATVQTSNGGLPPSFFDMGLKKPEDIVKELMGEPQEQCKMEEYDDEACSDNNMEAFNNDDDDNEDDEVGKLQYEIQFQTQLSTGGGGGGGGNASAATTTASSFFAMAQ